MQCLKEEKPIFCDVKNEYLQNIIFFDNGNIVDNRTVSTQHCTIDPESFPKKCAGFSVDENNKNGWITPKPKCTFKSRDSPVSVIKGTTFYNTYSDLMDEEVVKAEENTVKLEIADSSSVEITNSTNNEDINVTTKVELKIDMSDGTSESGHDESGRAGLVLPNEDLMKQKPIPVAFENEHDSIFECSSQVISHCDIPNQGSGDGTSESGHDESGRAGLEIEVGSESLSFEVTGNVIEKRH